MTEDFTVYCYDSSLNLLWEKALAHKAHELEYVTSHYAIEEASVFISPLNVQDEASGPGTIVVGASLKLRADAAPEPRVEGGMAGEDGDVEHPEIKIRAMLEHFSVYALDSKEGHIIWQHDGSDVRQEQYSRSLPTEALGIFSADASRMALHGTSNINDWSAFKSSLVSELPHFWRNREDTHLRFAHFVRRHIGAGSAKGKPSSHKAPLAEHNGGRKLMADQSSAGKKGKKSASSLLGETKFAGISAEPLSLSATLPHDASEHTIHPNVLVAHTKHGLEVIALRTGAPITSLALSRAQAYGDVDGDGIVDTIMVMENEADVERRGSAFAHEGNNVLQHCHLLVVSGLPARTQLFNGTVCLHRHALTDPVTRNARKLPTISSAAPLILRNSDPITNTEAKKATVVVATSLGMVTAYRGDGEFQWQSKDASSWDTDFAYHSLLHFDVDAGRAEEFGTHDNMYAHMLITGDKDLTQIGRAHV